MLTLFFNPRAGDAIGTTASRCDTERFARYFWELIDRGVYMPCSQYEALFVSAAHTEADIDATIARCGRNAMPRVIGCYALFLALFFRSERGGSTGAPGRTRSRGARPRSSTSPPGQPRRPWGASGNGRRRRTPAGRRASDLFQPRPGDHVARGQ